MARVWDPLKYGWSPHYSLTIQAIPYLFTEGLDGAGVGLTPPSGYTEEAAALVIDEGAAVGQKVDRDAGLGVGFPLTWRLLDTEIVRSLIRAPALTGILQADVTATATTFSLDDVTGWIAGDKFQIGLEQVTIGVVNAGPATLTGCTRGVNGPAYTHSAGSGASARITDLPRFWRGRLVELYANPVDPSGYAPGTALTDNAELIFRGHISAGPDRVGATWQFEALSLDRMLARPMSSSMTGTVMDTEIRTPANPDWPVLFRIEAFAAGASQWTEELIIRPFASDSYGDLVSESGVMDRITEAFEAEIATLGAPTTARLESVAWRQVANGTWKGAWEAGLSLDTNAAIDLVHTILLAGTGGHFLENYGGFAGGGTVVNKPVWLGWYYTAIPTGPQGVQRPKDKATIRLDQADPADVPDSGAILIGDALYTYTEKAAGTGFVYLGGLSQIGGAPPPEDIVGKSAEIFRMATDTLDDLIRQMITSSGTAALRSATYDTLHRTQGYGLEEDLLDVVGVGESVGALLKATPISVSSAGESMEETICPLLALTGRALVAKPVPRDAANALDPLHSYRIALIRTGPSAGPWAAEITDAHLMDPGGTPVEVRRIDNPPTRIKVEGKQAGKEIAPIQINDLDREVGGPRELAFAIPMIHKAPIVALAAVWAKARFAADLSAREVDLLTAPWIDAEIGDRVKVTVTHHSMVDLVTGAAGAFSGVGRVLGSSIELDTGLRRWTILFGGYFESLALCPSAAVQAFSTDPAPPGVGATIDVPIKYLVHWSRVLEEEGSFELTQYNPGAVELAADPNGYEFDGVEEVAGPLCRLTIRTVQGAPGVPTVGLTRLTTPKSVDSVAYQTAHLMHDGDGSSWGAGT